MVPVVKNPPAKAQDVKIFGFDPWRRAWQPTPVFLPGESHGQRSLAGYSPWGSQWVGHDWSDLALMHAYNIYIHLYTQILLFQQSWDKKQREAKLGRVSDSAPHMSERCGMGSDTWAWNLALNYLAAVVKGRTPLHGQSKRWTFLARDLEWCSSRGLLAETKWTVPGTAATSWGWCLLCASAVSGVFSARLLTLATNSKATVPACPAINSHTHGRVDPLSAPVKACPPHLPISCHPGPPHRWPCDWGSPDIWCQSLHHHVLESDSPHSLCHYTGPLKSPPLAWAHSNPATWRGYHFHHVSPQLQESPRCPLPLDFVQVLGPLCPPIQSFLKPLSGLTSFPSLSPSSAAPSVLSALGLNS